MRTIGLLNEKGGVGKTTLAIHIAAGLAIQGYRVVIVDADPQANATESLGHEPDRGLFEVVVGGAPILDWIRPVNPDILGHDVQGELFLLLGDDMTRVIQYVRPNPFLLSEYLREFDGWADYVIIDTSPTPNELHTSVYLATDGLIYPTEPEFLSLRGTAVSIMHREDSDNQRLAEGMTPIKTMGIQPTKYDTNTVAHDVGLRQLAQEFKRQLWPAIPKRTVWRSASWAGETLFRYAPDDIATQEAWSLIERVLKYQPEETHVER